MTYHTINKIGKGEYKSRGSKFYSFTHPIESIDDYKHLISIYKKDFSEACHVCSGYRLLVGSRIDEQGSDDGEPKGSAGLPILNQLKRNELVNVAVYVARIFGGSLLGIPGLIEAYSSAALLAIDSIDYIKYKSTKSLSIRFSYDYKGVVDSLITEYKGVILKQDFSGTIYLEVSIEDNILNAFIERIKDVSSNKIKAKLT